MLTSPEGRVIDDRDVQPKKVFEPIDVIPLGITIDVSDEHTLKAPSPKIRSPEGMFTDDKLVQ